MNSGKKTENWHPRYTIYITQNEQATQHRGFWPRRYTDHSPVCDVLARCTLHLRVHSVCKRSFQSNHKLFIIGHNVQALTSHPNLGWNKEKLENTCQNMTHTHTYVTCYHK